MQKIIISTFIVLCCHSVDALGSRRPTEDKTVSPKVTTSKPVEEEAPIKRYVYRGGMNYGVGLNYPYLAYFDVYQPGDTSSAVLLDSVIAIEGEGILFIVERKEIERFELVPEGNNLKIVYKDGYFTDPYFKAAITNLMPFPKEVTFGPGKFSLTFGDEFQGRLIDMRTERLQLPNRIDRFTPETYRPYINVLARGYNEETAQKYKFTVREPAVLHPVTFDEYFSAKGIEFPGLEQPTLDAKKITLKAKTEKTSSTQGRTGGNTSSPGFRPPSFSSNQYTSSKIEKPEDLELGEKLKGKEKAIFELMQSTDKPTVLEFVEAVGGWDQVKGSNPFSAYFTSESRLVDSVNTAVPDVIVQLESAYPNAIYYGLGRDIYLLSDAVDAYYVFHREEVDRVRRLHASHPSFDDKNISEVQRFLESNGFEFTDVAEQPPRIIFDITSYSKGFRYSQSSQLMRAAYRAMMTAKVDPQLAFSKVNFVSVSAGSKNIQMKPGFDFLDFFENLEVDTDNDGPKELLRTSDVNGLSYPETWHGIYSRFKTVDGQVVTEPGSLSSASTRLKMLGELWTIAREVQSDGFKTKVEQTALKYLQHASFEECKRLLED